MSSKKTMATHPPSAAIADEQAAAEEYRNELRRD